MQLHASIFTPHLDILYTPHHVLYTVVQQKQVVCETILRPLDMCNLLQFNLFDHAHTRLACKWQVTSYCNHISATTSLLTKFAKLKYKQKFVELHIHVHHLYSYRLINYQLSSHAPTHQCHVGFWGLVFHRRQLPDCQGPPQQRLQQSVRAAGRCVVVVGNVLPPPTLAVPAKRDPDIVRVVQLRAGCPRGSLSKVKGHTSQK